MVTLPRSNFSVQSMEDAKFFIEEYIPTGRSVSCRDLLNAGRGYIFTRSNKGELTAMKVQYGDDTVRSTYSGENAIALVYEARASVNAKCFPHIR